MHVFEDDQRRFPSLQLVERCGEDCVTVHSGVDCRQQWALRLACNVVQRGERPRREERVACPPQYTRVTLLLRKLS
jgi:hypothetical protein